MTEYYGTTRVTAEPAQVRVDGDEEDGHTILYEDGYRSWRPKASFEATYRKSGELNFGHALCALREGRRIYRRCWSVGQVIRFTDVNRDHIEFLDFGIDCPSRSWVPSISDVLAEDWCVVE